jgi:hypothetical protein
MPRDPRNIKIGPGWLKANVVGAVEPADLTTAWDVSWVDLGYTEEGHSFTSTPNFEAIEVAEELTPVFYEQTNVQYQLELALAEITHDNLKKVHNGGTITAGTGITTFEPPAVGVAIRIALGWESIDGSERYVFRKCLQTGAVEMARRKAPAKTTLPGTFQLELPGAGIAPWKSIQSVLV